MHVVMVYPQPFRRNLLFKCAAQPIAKNLLTLPMLGFNVVKGHRRWYPQKTS